MTTDSDADRDTTTDHGRIRAWVEEHGGYPGHLAGSEGEGDAGLLRIGFRDDDRDLKRITWDEFFEEFDDKRLEFVFPEDEDEIAPGGLLDQRDE